MYLNKKISVVIPAYNEQYLIKITINSLPDYLDKIYIIDDGSDDNTFNVVKDAANKRDTIMLLRHEENLGVGAAIISGYKKSLEDDNDITVVMGGDNQMDPKYILDLIEPIIKGIADYTKGNRLVKGYTKGMSKWRFFGNSLLTLLTKISSGYWDIMDPQNGYTAISNKVLNIIDLDSIYPKYGYCNDLLVKLNAYNFRILDVSIPARYGNEKSKIKYNSYIFKVSWLLLKNFFWRIKTKYILISFNPIALLYLLGLILTPLSIILGVSSMYYKIVTQEETFLRGLLPFLIFMIGIQFLLFAILFDIQMNSNKNK